MAPESILTVTDDNYEREIASGGNPCLLDFSAEWCGPCRQMEPLVEDVARRYEGRLRVGLVDIENSPSTAARFGVMSVPTFVFLDRQGSEVQRFIGSVPRERLEEAVRKVVD